MDGIQFYETLDDGTKVPLTAIFHKNAQEGLTREVEILEVGTGEREGWMYVRSHTFPWKFKGYRGFKTSHFKWVPTTELQYSTDDEKEQK